jgi:hypothetical protein
MPLSLPAAITTGLQTVTAAGAVPGVLDTSGATARFGIQLTATLTPPPPDNTSPPKTATCKIIIEDTANATEFSDASPVAIFDLAQGAQTIQADVATAYQPVTHSRRPNDMPSMRIGAAHCQLRAHILSITAGASLDLQAVAIA